MAALVIGAVLLLCAAAIIVIGMWVYRDLRSETLEHERRLKREERDYDVLMESVKNEKEAER